MLALGEVGERMQGPAIRGFELAKALAKAHRVTIVARNRRPARVDGIPVVPFTRRAASRLAGRSEAVVAPWLPPFLLAQCSATGKLAIADLYDPAELELAALDAAAGEQRPLAELTRLQLRHADAIVCANDCQAGALADRMSQVARRRPGPRVFTIPFGVGRPDRGISAASLVHGVPELRDGDAVVVWWGNIWQWLDAATAIDAVAALARRRPEVKLVFVAGSNPSAGTARMEALSAARAHAASLGLTGRSVFFVERWVPYSERRAFLSGASVGITLHRGLQEAEFAARARYLDYLAADVPCVLTRGDEMAGLLDAEGFAALAGVGRSADVADALERLLFDDGARRRARTAAAALRAKLDWEHVSSPLSDFIATSAGARARASAPALLADVVRYYMAQAARWRRR